MDAQKKAKYEKRVKHPENPCKIRNFVVYYKVDGLTPPNCVFYIPNFIEE